MSELFPELRRAHGEHYDVFCPPQGSAPALIVAVFDERTDLRRVDAQDQPAELDVRGCLQLRLAGEPQPHTFHIPALQGQAARRRKGRRAAPLWGLRGTPDQPEITRSVCQKRARANHLS